MWPQNPSDLLLRVPKSQNFSWGSPRPSRFLWCLRGTSRTTSNLLATPLSVDVCIWWCNKLLYVNLLIYLRLWDEIVLLVEELDFLVPKVLTIADSFQDSFTCFLGWFHSSTSQRVSTSHATSVMHTAIWIPCEWLQCSNIMRKRWPLNHNDAIINYVTNMTWVNVVTPIVRLYLQHHTNWWLRENEQI